MSLVTIAERWLPAPITGRLQPAREKIGAIIAGRDDAAISQRTAIFAFAIRIASAAIAYAMQVLMARWLGEFEYGIYVAVWVAIVILGGVSCLGFQTAIIRFISEYQTAGKHDHLRGVIRGSMIWGIAASTFLAISGSAIVYSVGDTITGYFVIPIYLAAICLPMLALHEIQDGVARAFDWPGTALGPTFILRPILILGAMAAAIGWGFEANAVTAMLAAIFGTWVASLSQFASLMIKLRRTVPKGPRSYTPRQWLIVAMPIFLVEGFYTLLTNTDILFVSYYMSPEQVGVYFAAVKTLALVHFVYFAVKAGAAHRFASYRTAGDHERFKRFVEQTVHWTFWPSLAMAIVMVLLGKYFLMLFGPAFVSGQELLWILAAGVVVRASVGAAESVLTMSGEQKACAMVYAASLTVNLTLNLFLIPIYGLKGAATATALAMIYESAALYSIARRRLGLHIFIIPLRKNHAISTGAGSR